MTENEPLQNEINSFSSMSILLVDDNKINQFLGKRILSNIGINDVEVAGDGLSALAMMQKRDYQVLLTDVEMPGMNGYELTTAVRNLGNGKNNITIIALTANSKPEEKEYALANGMNDYLSKPYSPEELKEVLQKHVMQPDTFMGIENSTHKSNGLNPIKDLYVLFNHNKDDVMNLLLLLKKQLPELMLSLKNDILSDNYENVFNSAHKLKSTIKLFNNEELFNCISDITEHSRTVTQISKIPSLYDELNKGVNEVLVLINQEIEML